MKKISAILSLVLMLLALLGGCKANETTPAISPNVPIVSESPAIPSPSPIVSPETSPEESPKATAPVKPTASPAASPAA